MTKSIDLCMAAPKLDGSREAAKFIFAEATPELGPKLKNSSDAGHATLLVG